MQSDSVRRALWIFGIILGAWLGIRYLLPVLLPFLIGTLLALASEPAVRFGVRKIRLPRIVASGLGVTLTLILLASVVSLVGALAVKELGHLAGALPDMEQGMLLVQDWAIRVADSMPDGARSLVTGTVLELFDDGSALLKQMAGKLSTVLGSVLGWIPDGALGLGTGILAGFMISARLPKLRQGLSARLPASWHEKYLPAIRKVKTNLGGWLKAQLKLTAVTYGIVTVGFLLLGVSYGPFWAILVALVDAVPILGTGTVLLPWALVELLQGRQLRAVGLTAVYVVAMLSRTVLEPRLVGKHLGLDPLVTLLFLYMGYRFWGILGMLLAPMLAAAAKSITEPKI